MLKRWCCAHTSHSKTGQDRAMRSSQVCGTGTESAPSPRTACRRAVLEMPPPVGSTNSQHAGVEHHIVYRSKSATAYGCDASRAQDFTLHLTSTGRAAPPDGSIMGLAVREYKAPCQCKDVSHLRAGILDRGQQVAHQVHLRSGMRERQVGRVGLNILGRLGRRSWIRFLSTQQKAQETFTISGTPEHCAAHQCRR